MKLVNHFIVCVDRSSSMSGLKSATVDALNQNIKAIQDGARVSGQEATFTLVMFSDRYETLAFRQPIEQVKPLAYSDYKPGGNTALFDAVGLGAIGAMQDFPDTYQENVSFVVLAITDGEENASRLRASDLLSRMRDVEATGRWSLAFLVPPGAKRRLCRDFNIPDGNVREWEQTQRGVEEAAKSVDMGISSYYTSRSAGQKATRGFFVTDLSKLNTSDVKAKLTDIRGSVNVLEVNRTDMIKPFVERELSAAYTPGYAFYQLMKDETVQHHKKIMLRDRNTGAIYGGNEGRGILGLPDGVDVKVRAGDHASWDIFVQSTSVNRKLVPGTRLLYLK